jgi:hypothetical protein
MIAAAAGAIAYLVVLATAHQPTTIDSTEKVKLVARARREETKFLLQWRAEWERNRDLRTTGMRITSLHCHADGTWPQNMPFNQITTPSSRKAMCPIWLSGSDDSVPDEALSIDNGLRKDGREKIRKRRADLLRLLDTTAAQVPESPWLIGQRVRLYVDQGDFARAAAIAKDKCLLDDVNCALLVGYVAQSRGNDAESEEAFAHAVSRMTLQERCAYLDISVFLEEHDKDSYESTPCEQRAAINARYWWLSDPLFVQPGNDRLTTHLFRQTLIMLHSALTIDERFDWRVKYGGTAVAEMLLRYGWPAAEYFNGKEDEDHFGWLGFKDSSANASREYLLPRYHTMPAYESALDPSEVDNDDFSSMAPKWNRFRARWSRGWWPIEHFARPGPITSVDYQAAVFRRAAGPLIAVALDPRSDVIPDSVLSKYDAALVSMSGPDDRGHRAAARAEGVTRLSLESSPGPQVVSAEVLRLDQDSAPAARARFGIDAPKGLRAMAAGEMAISDIMFTVAPEVDSLLPRSYADALPMMLPSDEILTGSRVGIFMESYGLSPGEAVEVTIKMTLEDKPGFLRRVGAKVKLLDPGDGSVVLHWRDDQPGGASTATTIDGVAVQSRAIVVDLSHLKAGHYSMDVGINRRGAAPVATRRDLSIRDR